MGVKLPTVHPDAHHHLFHGRVAGALAEAVDGALDLRGAVLHARQRQCRCHAQVVVAMDGNGDVLDAAHVFHEVLDALAELAGQAVARGVGDVHNGCAGIDDRLDHLCQKRVIGTAGVFGVELHVLDVLLRIGHGRDGALDALVLGDAELVVDMAGADADTRMDTGALSVLQSLGGAVDVLFHRTGQAHDRGVIACQLGDSANALEVAGTGDRKARFDDVDVQT